MSSSFAKIIDPIYFNTLKSPKKKMNYLIEKNVYTFTRNSPDRSHPFSTPSQRNINPNPDSIFSNYVRYNGSHYHLNKALKEEYYIYIKYNIINEIVEEEIYNYKYEVKIELTKYLDQKAKYSKLSELHIELINCFQHNPELSELYKIKLRGDKKAFEKEIQLLLVLGNNHEREALKKYLECGEIFVTYKNPRNIILWSEFSVNYSKLDYIKSLLNEDIEESFNLENVNNQINRFPTIFVDATACELFFYCMSKTPEEKMGQRLFSAYYQTFSGKGLIHSSRGINTAFLNFIKENFMNISKIESNVPRDIDLEMTFIEKMKNEFQKLAKVSF